MTDEQHPLKQGIEQHLRRDWPSLLNETNLRELAYRVRDRTSLRVTCTRSSMNQVFGERGPLHPRFRLIKMTDEHVHSNTHRAASPQRMAELFEWKQHGRTSVSSLRLNESPDFCLLLQHRGRAFYEADDAGRRRQYSRR